MNSEKNHDWRFVHDQLQSIAKRRAALDVEEARWLREAERLEIWRELGHPTMLAYIEATLGYGPKAAQERMRVAHALAELPAIEHALASGELSYSAVRELTRVACPETEDDWLIAAIDKNLRDVEELVAGHVRGDLPNSAAARDGLRDDPVRSVAADGCVAAKRAKQCKTSVDSRWMMTHS